MFVENKLELAQRMAAQYKNHRKSTWAGRVTAWFGRRAHTDEVWFHVDLDRERDRPVSVRMSGGQAREMLVDLVLRDGVSQPGLFGGELSERDRIAHLRLLVHLGVPEDVARDVSGVEA